MNILENILEKFKEEIALFKLGLKPSIALYTKKGRGRWKVFEEIQKMYREIGNGKHAYFYLIDYPNDSLILISDKLFKIGNKLGGRELGMMLGYPKCCINAFKTSVLFSFKRYKGQCKVAGDPYDIKLLPMKNGGKAIIPRYISHLPCNPECRKTKVIAERYRRGLI